MKVAVWGSYNYGNYGDDLMAIQFGLALRDAGVTPMIYRLDPRLAATYGLATTTSIDELLRDAKFGIIGGGGMLVGQSLLRFIFRRVAREIERDFRDLYQTSTKYKCPIYPLSVGGDGRGAATPLSKWRKAFWTSPLTRTPSVRLTQDVELLKSLGKDAIYTPDTLLTIGDLWKLNPVQQSPGKRHIGVNLFKNTGGPLAARLMKMVQGRDDVVLHFIRTHLKGPGYRESATGYEWMPSTETKNVKRYVYEDPKQMLEMLSGLDVLVSTKLHLGLTAVSVGTPFLSYGGKGKTVTFMKSLGAASAVYPIDAVEKVAELLGGPTGLDTFRSEFPFTAAEAAKPAARGHRERLKKLVEQHGAAAAA